jgi:hypothetical protein
VQYLFLQHLEAHRVIHEGLHWYCHPLRFILRLLRAEDVLIEVVLHLLVAVIDAQLVAG